MPKLTSALRTAFNILERENYLDIDLKQTISALAVNRSVYWSWGATNYKNLGGKAVYFKVNGRHHKGYVMVCLDPSDTFDVYIISTQGNIKEHYVNVYVDELATTIDRRIEHIPAYQY